MVIQNYQSIYYNIGVTNYCELIFWLFPCVVFRKSPGEGGLEVVPTPAARPSLRDMHSPQPHAKSTMEEDVKRHGAPDSPPQPRRHKDKVYLLVFLGESR